MAKLTVATARKLKRGRYSDDDCTGLCLQVSGTEQRAWLYRYQRNGKPAYLAHKPAEVVQFEEARA